MSLGLHLAHIIDGTPRVALSADSGIAWKRDFPGNQTASFGYCCTAEPGMAKGKSDQGCSNDFCSS